MALMRQDRGQVTLAAEMCQNETHSQALRRSKPDNVTECDFWDITTTLSGTVHYQPSYTQPKGMRFTPALVFHICVGILGLLSGATALSFRKGSGRHRVSGNIFALSMLSLGASGAYLGFTKHQTLNGLMGVLTFYLVATAWLTASRRDGEMRIFDWGALLVPLAVGVGLAIYGLEAANSQMRSKGGYPAGAYFIFGSLALLFAAGDIRMLLRGGVYGAQRIARHLWRMCFALFIATVSFFLGQQQVFPAFLRKANVLFIPAILPLILLIFWLIRVRFANAYKGKSLPCGGEAYSVGA
jgi:Predicted membrane protein (DUF2306)